MREAPPINSVTGLELQIPEQSALNGTETMHCARIAFNTSTRRRTLVVVHALLELEDAPIECRIRVVPADCRASGFMAILYGVDES